MPKKDDEISLLVNRTELENKARKDIKLNDQDAQRFIESIMTNYFLDNDNINFLENKGFNFFTFSLKEECFCISGKKYGECCFLKLNKEKDNGFTPYVKSLLKKEDYEEYVSKLKNIFEDEYKKYIADLKCFYPECSELSVDNVFYADCNKAEFVSSRNYNPFDAQYKMGEVFFRDIDEKIFNYRGFCQSHFNEIIDLHSKTDLNDKNVLLLAFEVIVYRLFWQMIFFKTSQVEFIKWINSVEEDGYKAYMVVSIRKTSSIIKGMLHTFKDISENILRDEILRLKFWKIELKKTNTFFCSDLVEPQVSPSDFKMINSVNNVLVNKKYFVQVMIKNKKGTSIYYIYDKLDQDINSFISQYQKKIFNKKSAEESFVSNNSLILTDNILLNKKWFNKLPDNDKKVYSAMNKYRLEQPDMGREYIKMQFFANFDKGNNFF